MRKILVIGAGRSSPALIKYLLDNSQKEGWEITVADSSLELAQLRVKNHQHGKAVRFDIQDEQQRKAEIRNADIALSLLPPSLHYAAAVDCVRFRKNLVTASYVSDEIKNLHKEAVKAGVLLLNETGLDPGIDHMSAMQIIHRLQNKNCELLSFKSYTGGLIAPESNDNPWGYKFTWNPRNVILAGQGTAKYIRDGKYHYIPYSRIFSEIEKISIKNAGSFDAYANRDSLAYRKYYGIEKIPTLIRGTLRNEGFCNSWNVFVKLGITDDSFKIENSAQLSYSQFIEAFIPPSVRGKNLKERLARFAGLSLKSEAIEKILWTGILSNEKVKIQNATPAEILQNLLDKKWKLHKSDKDMIVMIHLFEYRENGKKEIKKLKCWMMVKGDNSEMTAMAKTVGFPMGIAAKNILNGKIKLTGVQIPVQREIYEPVMRELKELNIKLND